MSAVEVRRADEGDVETMAAIYLSAAREGWAHIFGEERLATVEPPVERLRAELTATDPRQRVLVADRGECVVGYAVVRPSRDEDSDDGRVGELDAFFCDPTVWGQGVGRALLASAIDALRESGFTEATLWTSPDNHRPRRIYEAAGWKLDGTTRDKPWREASWRDLRYRITL